MHSMSKILFPLGVRPVASPSVHFGCFRKKERFPSFSNATPAATIVIVITPPEPPSVPCRRNLAGRSSSISHSFLIFLALLLSFTPFLSIRKTESGINLAGAGVRPRLALVVSPKAVAAAAQRPNRSGHTLTGLAHTHARH